MYPCKTRILSTLSLPHRCIIHTVLRYCSVSILFPRFRFPLVRRVATMPLLTPAYEAASLQPNDTNAPLQLRPSYSKSIPEGSRGTVLRGIISVSIAEALWQPCFCSRRKAFCFPQNLRVQTSRLTAFSPCLRGHFDLSFKIRSEVHFNDRASTCFSRRSSGAKSFIFELRSLCGVQSRNRL